MKEAVNTVLHVPTANVNNMVRIEYKESMRGNHLNVEKKAYFLGIRLYTLKYSKIIAEVQEEKPEKNEQKQKIGYNYENKSKGNCERVQV